VTKCQQVATPTSEPQTDEVATVVSDAAPAMPLWKIEADSLKEAKEAAAKAQELADAAQALKNKEEEEKAAKAAQEAASKENAAAEAEEKKPKKKATSKKAGKKKEEKTAAAEEEKPAEAPPAEAPAAANGPLDRQQIKEREQAFKARPQKEQDDLGKQIRTAAKEGNLMEVKNLLESGVAPNPPDKDGWIALMEAAQAGHAEVCKLLLDYGADPKATIKLGEWGMSALHYAARNGHLEVAKVLAPVSKLAEKNFQSKTAAEVAKAAGYKDIAKVCKPKS